VYWSWRETSGTTAAIWRLWDGSNNAGALVAPFSLNAGESIREFPGFHTLPYRVGLFLEVLSGTIEGQVTIIPWGEKEGEYGMPVVIVGSVDLTLNAYGTGQ
jgi:hypothetical protein